MVSELTLNPEAEDAPRRGIRLPAASSKNARSVGRQANAAAPKGEGKVRKIQDLLDQSKRLGFLGQLSTQLPQESSGTWEEKVAKLSPQDRILLEQFLSERLRGGEFSDASLFSKVCRGHPLELAPDQVMSRSQVDETLTFLCSKPARDSFDFMNDQNLQQTHKKLVSSLHFLLGEVGMFSQYQQLRS